MNRIYLDSAAATPVDPRVMRVMTPYFSEIFYNPSALYEGARMAKEALEQARADVSKVIGARPSEIIFTAGGTESINLAIHGIMRSHDNAEIIVSSIEHEAVLKPAEKYNVKYAKVDENGRLDVQDVAAKITENTVLVSVMLANNEVGSLQPVKEVIQLVDSVRANRRKAGSTLPLYVHTDACQAPLYTDIHVARLGVDMMTLNGGKIHGPKQSGILYVKSGINLQPIIRGGGQEWGYRSGTENVAFAVGFVKALELSQAGKKERTKKVSELRDYLMQQLEEKFQAQLNGHRKLRLANNIHATFIGADNERVLFALDDLGVDAAAGSACSASNDVSSHVLLAMGKTADYAQSSIRFSLLQTTTKQEIDGALDRLQKALQAYTFFKQTKAVYY